MRLAVLSPTLGFEKGNYILKSLAEGLSLLDSRIEVYPVGYHDVVLFGTHRFRSNFPSLYRVLFPKVYKLSTRRGFKHLKLLVETTSFVKFILKNFDCILLGITALYNRGVLELTKHYFPMILWDGDSPNIPYLIYSQYLNEDRHILLCYSKGGCELWRRYGVNPVFFPYACDTTLFYPTKSQPKNIPILFTGRYLRDRSEGHKKFLYPLVRRFGEKVVIVGAGWKENPIVKGAKVLNYLPYTLLNVVYNMAKICINIHRDNQKRTHTALNLRTFEIMGSGQICISDRVAGVEEFFQPGEEIIVCSDADEMLDNIEKYLSDELSRSRVASAGHSKVVRAHTIKHRAAQLIEILEKYDYLKDKLT